MGRRALATAAVAVLAGLAACSTPATQDVGGADTDPSTTGPGTSPTSMPTTTPAPATASTTTAPRASSTTTIAADAPRRTTSPPPSLSTTDAPTPEPPTTTATGAPTTAAPRTTSYRVPVREVAAAGWTPGHAGYPATDIFAACGAELVAPVTGVALEVRRTDRWDPATDDPATRGGRSVSILGDDGVRYYLSHLDEVDGALVPGARVELAQRLGTVGLTGRTSACHVHFGISPPCPSPEWSVRRGVIDPAPYLDAWRAEEPRSPVDEVGAWVAANPDACELAAADPHAAGS